MFENSLKQNKNRIFFLEIRRIGLLDDVWKSFKKITTDRNREENKSLFTITLSEFVIKI